MLEHATARGGMPDPNRRAQVEEHWQRQQDEITTREVGMLRSASAPGARIDPAERRAIAKLKKTSALTRKILDGWDQQWKRDHPAASPQRPITHP